MRYLQAAVVCSLLAASHHSRADEGMWTFDNFPAAQVQARYEFEAGQDWLDHLRLSSARLAGGCSASFVSPQGLVLTNHHCVHRCIEQLSSAKRDYVEAGFLAKDRSQEQRCPNTELNQLISITDVTSRIREATLGLEGGAYASALRQATSTVEKECATSTSLRCDVVNLYNGGQYKLYQYRRFQDVRLVFAPEVSVGFFGGDPDNFNFPRYNLDAAFLRVWEEGKPAHTPDYLRWSAEGAQEGELSFTSGHPGRTDRLLTVSELEMQRDIVLPRRIFYLSELRGLLTEYQRRGPEQRRVAKTLLFGVENSLKVQKGMREALVEPALLERKLEEERALRAWAAEDPEREARWGSAWGAIAEAQQRMRHLHDEYLYVEGTSGFQGNLVGLAKLLVRAGEERGKPNEERLQGFGEANLPALEQRVFSPAPLYPDYEETLLAFSLTKLREVLGVDHPFVQATLGKESPEELARRVIRGSQLTDLQVRRQLWQGGAAAIAASKDPLIVWMRGLDPLMREVQARYEAEVESRVRRNSERIAEARFAAIGDSTYPDATFTLRISYGTVKGWEEGGVWIPPLTTMAGLFERATGSDPYRLPKRWLDAKGKVDLSTPMNFVSDNDIIGGNSGSPVVNRKGELIGLVFDGNIHALGGDYGFDPELNRTVSVHSQAILESLRKVYGAQHILDELQPPTVTKND